RGASLELREVGVVDEIRPLDQHEEVVPLLRRDRAEADETVARRLDRRDLRLARGEIRRRTEAPVERVRVDDAEGHGLEERDVDVLAASGRVRSPPRGERGERR